LGVVAPEVEADADADADADDDVFCDGSKAGAVEDAALRNSARKAIL